MEIVLGFDWPANASLSACFKIQLPAAWARKPCIKLVQIFIRQYKEKHANTENPIALLKTNDFELLSCNGLSVDLKSLIGETLQNTNTEFAVALKVEVERRLIAPIIVALGEIETLVGVAGEDEPRAIVPSYVKEVFVKNHLTAELTAGGSVHEKRCKNPGQRQPYYPIGSCGIKSYAPLVTELQKVTGKRYISSRGWKDVELIFRNALLEANLDIKNRHVIIIAPCRAPLKFRSDAMELCFRQYGAQSVAVVPLSSAAMVLTAKNTSTRDTPPWSRAVCVLEVGHDSSCATATIPGAPECTLWTLRGGSEVSLLFKSLVKSETSNNPIDDREESHHVLDHKIHLMKKRYCVVRDLDGPDPHVRAVIDDVLISEACYLSPDTLFAPNDGPQSGKALQDLVAQTIRRVAGDNSEEDVDCILLENIIVTGWPDACLRGLERRLAQELYRLVHGDVRICVSRAPMWKSALAMAAELANEDSATAWVMTRDEFIDGNKTPAKDPRLLLS
mmetsp:Transcript_12740/g.19122  ORF Transcript_12740/g.19122 Transcript_12740/m.19122 type:complete len:505 (+) Transcript_12740:78-1592(+)